MNRYKLLKDLPFVTNIEWVSFWKNWECYNNWIPTGWINEIVKGIMDHNNKYCVSDLFYEWFEDIKEKPSPKYKIWEYVVSERILWIIEYIKISCIKVVGGEFKYEFKSYTENELRKPTEEELLRFFRY